MWWYDWLRLISVSIYNLMKTCVIFNDDCVAGFIIRDSKCVVWPLRRASLATALATVCLNSRLNILMYSYLLNDKMNVIVSHSRNLLCHCKQVLILYEYV